MKNLSIGILTHNSPLTLENTLKSYKDSGILEYTDDLFCLIQPSDKAEEESKICSTFNLNHEIESTNTMMAGAIRKMVERSKKDYFLFLEADFRSCKNKEITKNILDFSLNEIKSKNLDVIRLRNLKNPGHPIHWGLQKSHGLGYNNNTELYLCTHYLENPHLKYPEFITKLNENPILYEMKSKNCVYTNNPNITSKKFYIDNILPYARPGAHLEPEIFNFWKDSNFRIGITSGIFTHIRLDGHGGKACYCCPAEYGGHSDKINCVCCDKLYRPHLYDKKIDIQDKLDEKIDEQYCDNLHKNLRSTYYSNS